MKLSIVSTAALAVAASAIPLSRHRRHQEIHEIHRRDVVINTVTDVVTQTAPAAVVYVNQAGETISTAWNQGGQPTGGWGQPWSGQGSSSAAPVSSSAPQSSFAPPAPQSSPAGSSPPESGSPAPSATPSSYPSQSSAAPAPSASAPSGGTGGAGAPGYGLSYAPYNSDGSCKTADQIKSDMDAFSDYGTLRIYGTDCDQVANVLPAASARNMKLFAGVWDVSDVSSEVQLIIDAAKNNWDAIDTISIGNEVINSGTGTVDEVVSAVNTARSLLKAAGYNGKVVTVDTFNQIIANPQLCQVSDFAAANCHAFFDSSISADQAGSYVKEQAQRVQQACGGKDTVITESGWPSNGDSNGAAVPSEANQQAAISSLRSAFSSNLVLFSAFNDVWKQNFDGSFNAEHYWGIYGNAPA